MCHCNFNSHLPTTAVRAPAAKLHAADTAPFRPGYDCVLFTLLTATNYSCACCSSCSCAAPSILGTLSACLGAEPLPGWQPADKLRHPALDLWTAARTLLQVRIWASSAVCWQLLSRRLCTLRLTVNCFVPSSSCYPGCTPHPQQAVCGHILSRKCCDALCCSLVCSRIVCCRQFFGETSFVLGTLAGILGLTALGIGVSWDGSDVAGSFSRGANWAW